MTFLKGGRVVTAAGVLDDAWLEVEDDRISQIGRGPFPPGTVDLGGEWVLPGFIDLHVHGGGGHDVAESAADMAAAVAYHRRHGTTRTLVSLNAAPTDTLAQGLRWVAEMVAQGGDANGRVIGAHLEGPFLSEVRRGAQNPAYLLMPDRDIFARLVEAAGGTLRSVTIAPELPGALEVIDDVLAAGAVAAIGHTDATYAEASAAVDAGASLATHLFNGMRPVHHREPGAVGAWLLSGLACEVINDGVHVHPSITTLVASMPQRLVLITDANKAAGAGDGDYMVGGRHLRVTNGQVRVAGTDTLAGSSLTMDAAVQRAVRECHVPIEVASAAASGNPARVLGIDAECGAIAVGQAADLVVLDSDLLVTGVLCDGYWSGPTTGWDPRPVGPSLKV